MKSRRVVLRERAAKDVEEAVDDYLNQGAEPAASGLIDALETAFAQIARFPAAGSPRYALELNLPGLRSWPLHGFPYLLFYLERGTHVDVWRVLHQERDIPAWMREA
jgi:toxin ParE1/3/4